MRIVFMGTPEFAVPALKELIKKHNVMLAVCQPDKPNNRGKKIVFNPVKQFAIDSGISVMQPESVRDKGFINELAALRPDVIAVAAYGQILPKEILNVPKFGCINVHGSLLPKYRGAAPIQWAIINGEDQTGVTIMRMSEKLDAGDMIQKRHISLEDTDTYGSLLQKLAVIGAGALIESLEELKDGTAKTIMQNDAEATYAPIINKEIGHIDWSNGGYEIVNLVRGLNPAPSAYSELDGVKLKIFGASVFGKAEEELDFGQIIDVLKTRGILVNAKNESVLLTELQASGSKKMPAVDFVRGRGICKGMLLK